MGDRCQVVFRTSWVDRKTNKRHVDFSPAVYLHSDGPWEDVKRLLDLCGDSLRTEDPWYSAAHFCGVCYRDMAGDEKSLVYYGLGLFDLSTEVKRWLRSGTSKAHRKIADAIGCDNGMYLIDVDNGSIIQIGYEKTIDRGVVKLGKY